MTSQQPLITDDTFRELWRAYGLGTIKQITKLTSSKRNLCFFVNDTFVVKFNTKDDGSPKFRCDQYAYTHLARQQLPVPDILVLDETHLLTPYDVFIVTRLPGQSLVTSWRLLPEAQLNKLIYAAGQHLARVHSCTFPTFGRLREPKYASWAAFVREMVEIYLVPARQLNLLSPEMDERLERSLDRAMKDLADIDRGALVHRDFHYGNVLHNDGRISGLIDFEWALSGDPAYDFMLSHVRERDIPNSEAMFSEGYQSVRPFDRMHDRKLFWYRLFLTLIDVVMYANAGDRQTFDDAYESLRDLLHKAEQYN
jgi:Ser/Thr protein kinase RdoA (MazF antagonist)